jgi:hypothetical protein
MTPAARSRRGFLAGVGALAFGSRGRPGAPTTASEVAGRLAVSTDGRHLVDAASGRPFLYLADTAWELFHRLDREQAERYLTDRAAKGFTVIQAVALAELDGLRVPNAYGHRPFVGEDPTRPALAPGGADDYWDHVDWIVDRAAELGLFVGLLPTWGDKWNERWGVGRVVFDPPQAEEYGRFLGERYAARRVIWILGGDRNPETPEHVQVVRALARGLARGDGGAHLMTYHPQGGGSSAQWFHEDDWLDFNMFQSGHAALLTPNHATTLRERERRPVKPVLDGEPCYEDHPVNWKPEEGWFDEWDVRRAAWGSLLSGACGHTYGNHNVWQMWQPGREPVSAARTAWYEALDHPGAFQMGHLRWLLERRPWHELEPAPGLLADPNPPGADHKLAARAADGSFALVYLPTGGSVGLNASILGAGSTAHWFNPRQRAVSRAAPLPADAGRFSAPATGRNNDWLLVVDAGTRELPALG